MTGYRLTIAARRHLAEILDYSIDQWGVHRAEAYVGDIDRALAALVRTERHARPCDHIAPNLSFIRSGSHHIYLRYDAAADVYDIVGVLHQSMDAPRHLTLTDEGK